MEKDDILTEAVTILPYGIMWKFDSSFKLNNGNISPNLFMQSQPVLNLRELVWNQKTTDLDLYIYNDVARAIDEKTFPIFNARLLLKINFGTAHTPTSTRLSIQLPTARLFNVSNVNKWSEQPLLITNLQDTLQIEYLINLHSNTTKLHELTENFMTTIYKIAISECKFPEIGRENGQLILNWV